MKWFRPRNRHASWEVVGCETIAPVFMFDSEVDSQDEGKSRTCPEHYPCPTIVIELEFVYAEGVDTCGRYIFDFTNHTPSGIHCASAVLFARQQLLQQVKKKGFNVLLQEGSVPSEVTGSGTSGSQVLYTGGRLRFCDKRDVIEYRSTTQADPAVCPGSYLHFALLLSWPC